MFRITNQAENDRVALRLEGKLCGPWVAVLRECWNEKKQTGAEVTVDLSGVSFVDSAGRALLREMSTSNAQFIARDCQMKAILAEITMSNTRAH